MATHDIKQLDENVAQIQAELKKIAADRALTDLRKLFPRPGWTTPAEFRFAMGITNALLSHLKAFNVLKETLIEGSNAVTK